ncbi:MAG: shikimate dehydrogenase [Bacteroidales bacterium]|nr:shikimate dehydrogenase [Bacteroidales bacterium]
MKKYGLIGFPLGHSFSAGFFAEKFAKEGLDARYDNYEMPTVEGLRTLIESDSELCGLNVTIPHKQAVIPLLDDLTPEARAIGAVNVIRIERTIDTAIRLIGCNSDIIGFTESIRPLLKPHHTKALVLGTGGASKAVVAGLRSLGIEPTYVSRRPAPGQFTYDDLRVESAEGHSSNIIIEHTVIVNCSPVGMHPHTDEAPAIPYEQLTPRHLLYDLVYNPLDTRFMQLGREHGATVKNGLEMLHLQAIAAWEMWNQ